MSIQLDLGGLSFVVREPNLKIVKRGDLAFDMPMADYEVLDDNLTKAFHSNRDLEDTYSQCDLVYHSEKYTLVPESLFTPLQAASMLRNLFALDELDEVNYTSIAVHKAVCIYALPGPLTAKFIQNQHNTHFYTGISPLLQYLSAAKDYSRALLYFFSDKVHLLLMQGTRLLLVNTYRATDAKTAMYFLFLALKQWQMNSRQLRLFAAGKLPADSDKLLQSYFPNFVTISDDLTIFNPLCEL